jgi:CheY-like chemotaxis protein
VLVFAPLKAEGVLTLVAEPAGVVLIVDDNPNNLGLLGSILGGRGYKVRGASDGEQAMRIASKRAPDLILLDIQMPGADGYEVCRRAVDYVTKPFQAPEVLSRVGAHLQLLWLTLAPTKDDADLVRWQDVARYAVATVEELAKTYYGVLKPAK